MSKIEFTDEELDKLTLLAGIALDHSGDLWLEQYFTEDEQDELLLKIEQFEDYREKMKI